MGKTNSKNLGNNFERQFSYMLSEWLTGEKGSDVCWRDLGSGNRKTSREKKGLDTSRKADIVCTDLNYQYFFDIYYIDTKSYKEINWCFINPKNKKSNKLFQQWIKTVDECPENMIPLMPVMVRDHKTPILMFLPKQMYLNSDLPCMFISLNNKYSFYIVLLEEFFQHEKPKHFYEKNKNFVVDKSNI